MHVSKNNHGWWTVRFACRFDLLRFIVIISTVLCICVAHSGHGRSQWETTLQCNSVSHWLSLSPKMIPVTYIFLMLLRCHWCNSMIVPVSVHWSWKIWIRPLFYISTEKHKLRITCMVFQLHPLWQLTHWPLGDLDVIIKKQFSIVQSCSPDWYLLVVLW